MSKSVISSDKYPLKPHNCKRVATCICKAMNQKLTSRRSPSCQDPRSCLRIGSSWSGRHRDCYCQSTLFFTQSVPLTRIMMKKQSLTALKDVLELAGSSLDKVVKFNIYLTDMNDMLAMNDVLVPVSLNHLLTACTDHCAIHSAFA